MRFYHRGALQKAIFELDSDHAEIIKRRYIDERENTLNERTVSLLRSEIARNIELARELHKSFCLDELQDMSEELEHYAAGNGY